MPNDPKGNRRRQPLAPLYHDLLSYLAAPYADDRLPTLEVKDGKFIDIYPFVDLTREGKWAAEHVVRHQLVSRINPNHHLWQINEAGRAEIAGPRPEWQPPPPRLLTREDMEILRDAVFFNRVAPKKWFTPKDIGGRDSSNHSVRMCKLVHHGLMEYKESRTGDENAVIGDASVQEPRLIKSGGKPNRVYRVTTKTLRTFDKLWDQMVINQRDPANAKHSEDA